MTVAFALLLGGCAACEPIDTSGCAGPFDDSCHTYTIAGATCNPWVTVCSDSPCTCDEQTSRVDCHQDLSVPRDLSPTDLASDDAGADDGGLDGGGLDGGGVD